MGAMAQLAFSNFLVFAFALLLIIYITYLLIKRAVEKNDGDFTSEAKEWNKGSFLKKCIFTFLYAAMAACLIYLVTSDSTDAIIFSVVFFLIGLVSPERTRKPNPRIEKIVSIVFLLLLIFLTAIWSASISIKAGAWLILIVIYLLDRIEKKYFYLRYHKES